MPKFYWKDNQSDVATNDFIHDVWKASKWNDFIDFCNTQTARLWDEREDKKHKESKFWHSTATETNPDAGYWDYSYWQSYYADNNNPLDIPDTLKVNPNPGNKNPNTEKSLVTAQLYNDLVQALAEQLAEFNLKRYSDNNVEKDKTVILAMHAMNLQNDANTLGDHSEKLNLT